MKAITSFLLPCLLWLKLSCSLYAQTTLTAGDIAFVGWNSYDDATNGLTNDDQIAFVLLKDIAPNTVIYFTDFGWVSTVNGNPQSQFQTVEPCGASTGSTSDGIVKWTSPNSTLTCGQFVYIKVKYLSSATLTNIGTVTGIYKNIASASTTYISLPTGGDQAFAFQVPAANVAALNTGVITNPTLIAGFNTKVAWDASLDNCAFASTSSVLPTALVNASFIIPSANASDLSARRNARFNCSGNTTAAPSVLRASMNSSTNWIFNQLADATGVYNFASFGCTFTCSAASPDISAQPTNQVTCDGRSAAFTVTATNTTGYQWQVSTNGGAYTNLSNTGVYSNVTAATLNISNATGLNGNMYRCTVSNASLSVNSNGALLTVNRFALHPSNMTTCTTCAAGFTVSARGSGLTYQWQESSNGTTFSNLSNTGVYTGVNAKTLMISNASGLSGRQYRCVLGGCASPINSNAATLTTQAGSPTTLVAGDVVINAYNSSDDLTNGTTQDDEIVFVILKDIVAGTEISLTDFGWRSDIQAFISGVTTSCPAGIIKWIAASNLTCGSQVKVKSKYLLEANTGVVFPIATNTNDASIYVSLSASDVIFAFQGAFASPTLLYGLQMNAWTTTVTSCTGSATSALPTVLNAAGLNIALGRDGSGANTWTNANYNCTNVNATPSSLRTSISTGTNWAKTTTAISLPVCTFTCNSGAPQITTQPTNFTTCTSRTATFSVVASGTNTFKWQIFNGSTWDYLINNAIYSSVTTNTLTINDATSLNGKQYRCEVTNAVTFVNSNSATLTVNRFINQPINISTCTGCETAFSVLAAGSGLTYQWQESTNGTTFNNLTNGGVYSGVTTNILKISNASSPTNLHTRQYRVVLGGCVSPINSDAKTLSVGGAASTIAVGDITFIGYNIQDDGVNGLTNDDEFAFILLKDINAGTQINFTDFGWRSDANAFHESSASCGGTNGSSGDGILKWIAGSNLTCGTQITIKSKYTLQANLGVVAGVQSLPNDATAFVSLATGGDQIFAFTGTYASPTLLAGLSLRTWDATLTSCELTSTKSVKPAALNGYVVEFAGASVNYFARYKCSAPTKDLPSVVRAATQNTANWDVNSLTPYTLPLTCSFCCSATFSIVTHPSNQTICAGSATSFSVATNPSSQTFKWQVNTGGGFVDLTNTTPYSGVSTNNLNISVVTSAMNNYQYQCNISNVCGNSNSNSATLTVPNITQPTSVLPTTSTINHPNPIPLSASCTSGSQVVWFGSLTGTVSLGVGNISQTPASSGKYTYYALCRQTASPTCSSTSRVSTGLINYCGLTANNLPNYSNTIETIKAATSISINNLISNSSNITYQAGNFVELLPGFSVTGSVFKAQLGGCN